MDTQSVAQIEQTALLGCNQLDDSAKDAIKGCSDIDLNLLY
jgi:hypothetical protein